MPSKKDAITVVNLPLTDYQKAWALQHQLVEAKKTNELDEDVILLLEHPPVYTLGKRGGKDNLIVSDAHLKSNGIDVVQVERGGNITYHGPGQLVGYPIVHLRDRNFKVRVFVEMLEEVMIQTAHAFGVTAGRDNRNNGIWVGDNKMGSVGISITRSITFHGFALNVSPNLTHFSWINPCGLQNVGVTSIEKESGQAVSMEEVKAKAMETIQSIFDAPVSLKSMEKVVSSLIPKAGDIKEETSMEFD